VSAPDIRWPRLGLGCASLGAPELSDVEAERVIAAAIERGIRFFDVAPLYGGGLAEERLGRALAPLPRDSYVLCTKAGVTRPYGQPPLPPGATRRRQFDVWDYSAAATRTSVERSLARLRTDRLDVVHLHDTEDHLDACLVAYAEIARLRDAGIVGAIGIGSNLVAPVQHLIDRARFDTFLLAGRYTMLDSAGRTLIDTAHARGIAVVAGGVFNSGVLAAWPQSAPTYGYQPADAAVVERTARIAAICARHGVPLAAAALQFVLANPAITTVLLGPRTPAELEANVEATECDIERSFWLDLADADVIPPDSPGLPERSVRANLSPQH
jgi:aryl-alcohol dehydrogenase-like predicted oxidoreductase